MSLPGKEDVAMHRSKENKLLLRFFEPLIILSIICYRTQGDRIPEQPTEPIVQDGIPSRREILRQLCRVCDYKKGGETVTAIVAESCPAGPVYWVSSDQEALNDIEPFLCETLATIQRAIPASRTEDGRDDLEQDLFTSFTFFAKPRLTKTRGLLLKQVEEASRRLQESALSAARIEALQIWLSSFKIDMQPPESDQVLYGQCRRAWHEGQSHEVRQIVAILNPTGNYGQGSRLCLLKHYLGRMAATVTAARVLSAAPFSHPMLFEGFTVKPVTCGGPRPGPLLDDQVNLPGIAKRMLPKASPNLPELQEALEQLNQHHGLLQEVRKQFLELKFRPRVHAEIALLEAVYTAGITFVDDDKYIACSKAACFCCYHYICEHPGGFEKPASSNNLWLNWRVPDPANENDEVFLKRQRDVLIKANQKIKALACERVISQSGISRRWHPDSSTGFGNTVTDSKGATTQLPTTKPVDIGARGMKSDPVLKSSSYGSSTSWSSRSLAQSASDEDTDAEDGGVKLDGSYSKLAIY